MENSTRQIQHTPPKPRRLVDNAAEVRRRKEAAERLIKERHEALRRQHEEKIHKINEERQRLQRELKERHAKELKRQQDVLQRRMALMERDKARKQEILEKNHAVASRLSTNSSRKNYAFGSSTPRELSFLDPRILKMNAMEKRYSPDKQQSTNDDDLLQSPPNGAISASAINARRGRSMASVLSTSMYDHSNDRTRHTASTTRLTQPKTTPPKPQNHMTQSVYHPAPTPTTPVARLRRKPLSQVTNSVPNTPLAGNNAPVTPKRFEKSKNANKATPKHVANKKEKAPSPPPAGSASPQRKESLARSEDIPTPLGVTASEPPRSENSFTSDEIPLDMAEKEVHYEVSVDSPPAEMHHHEITPNGGENHEIHENPSEAEETTLVNEVDVVIEPPAAVMNHAEQASEEEAVAATFTKDVVIASPEPAADEQLISPVPKQSDVEAIPVAEIASPLIAAPAPQEGGASLADELASVFGGPASAAVHEENNVQPPLIVEPPSVDMPAAVHSAEKSPVTPTKAEEAPLVEIAPEKAVETPAAEKNTETAHAEMPTEKPEVEKPVGKVSYENPLIDFSTAGEGERNKSPSTISTESVHTEVINHVHTNGIEHKAHPEIAAELPGTVPSKDGDVSVMRKVPTPPNEFLISTQAHRLRREQEQREIDERKARIAAILAKSRDLSGGAPVVGGRISPPRGETAQDVLKRLASNGNIPALQKLVARRTTPEPPAIDQIAPEDPAPQAI